MAAQSTQAPMELLKQLAARTQKAHETYKSAPVDMGNEDLPAGIEGGIAQIREIKIDTVKEGKDNAGKLQFFAQASIVAPKTFLDPRTKAERKIEGLFTRIIVPLYKTDTKSEEDYIGTMYNELKKLGGENILSGVTSVADVPAICEALKKKKLYTRFRTWVGSPLAIDDIGGKFYVVRDGKRVKGPYATLEALKSANKFIDRPPMVNHQWLGSTSFEGNGQMMAAAPELEDSGPSDETPPDETPADEPQSGMAGDDIAALIEAATAKDKTAQKRLKEIALAAGVSEEAFEAADDWEAAGVLIQEAQEASGAEAGEEGGASEEDEEPYEPKKGDEVKFRPTGKDGKKLKTPVKCEVTSVSKKTETVTLKNSKDAKIVYKDVPFDDLIVE
jgi:hypothetical protein